MPDAPTATVPVAAAAGATPAVLAVNAAIEGARSIEEAGRRDPKAFFQFLTRVGIAALVVGFAYLVFKDFRSGHAITQEEFRTALDERDKHISPATDTELGRLRASIEAIRVAGIATTTAVESLRDDMRTIRAESKVERDALRAEIHDQGTRIDRLLERLK